MYIIGCIYNSIARLIVECGIVCHSKCVYSVPQACYRKSSLDNSKSDADSTRHMFGNDLIKQIHAEKSKVPLVVEKCIESVESRGNYRL